MKKKGKLRNALEWALIGIGSLIAVSFVAICGFIAACFLVLMRIAPFLLVLGGIIWILIKLGVIIL